MTDATNSLPTAADLDAHAEELRAKAETSPPPTPEEIDAEIVFYENAKACFSAAKKTMEGYEEKLIELTDKHGFRPEGAPRSTRLAGRRKTVTVTRGQTVKLNEPAIQMFAAWCRRRSKMNIFAKLFAPATKYTLIETPREVLKRLHLRNAQHLCAYCPALLICYYIQIFDLNGCIGGLQFHSSACAVRFTDEHSLGQEPR